MSWFSFLVARGSREARSDAPLFFTNTLSGKKEVFSAQKAGLATMYSCGPTVYSKQHIGNLKAHVFSDLVARVLLSAGYRVRRVINITDVGHLAGDGDEGEDKIEAGAKKEGRRAEDIATEYANLFIDDLALLNVDTDSIKFPRATDYIKEQIAIVKILEEKGAMASILILPSTLTTVLLIMAAQSFAKRHSQRLGAGSRITTRSGILQTSRSGSSLQRERVDNKNGPLRGVSDFRAGT